MQRYSLWIHLFTYGHIVFTQAVISIHCLNKTLKPYFMLIIININWKGEGCPHPDLLPPCPMPGCVIRTVTEWKMYKTRVLFILSVDGVNLTVRWQHFVLRHGCHCYMHCQYVSLHILPCHCYNFTLITEKSDPRHCPRQTAASSVTLLYSPLSASHYGQWHCLRNVFAVAWEQARQDEGQSSADNRFGQHKRLGEMSWIVTRTKTCLRATWVNKC